MARLAVLENWIRLSYSYSRCTRTLCPLLTRPCNTFREHVSELIVGDEVINGPYSLGFLLHFLSGLKQGYMMDLRGLRI
ncbi:MAG: hypothetical protein AMXMBFR84_20370 [Candidatus Hydrogenedentota bacterium]